MEPGAVVWARAGGSLWPAVVISPAGAAPLVVRLIQPPDGTPPTVELAGVDVPAACAARPALAALKEGSVRVCPFKAWDALVTVHQGAALGEAFKAAVREARAAAASAAAASAAVGAGSGSDRPRSLFTATTTRLLAPPPTAAATPGGAAGVGGIGGAATRGVPLPPVPPAPPTQVPPPSPPPPSPPLPPPPPQQQQRPAGAPASAPSPVAAAVAPPPRPQPPPGPVVVSKFFSSPGRGAAAAAAAAAAPSPPVPQPTAVGRSGMAGRKRPRAGGGDSQPPSVPSARSPAGSPPHTPRGGAASPAAAAAGETPPGALHPDVTPDEADVSLLQPLGPRAVRGGRGRRRGVRGAIYNAQPLRDMRPAPGQGASARAAEWCYHTEEPSLAVVWAPALPEGSPAPAQPPPRGLEEEGEAEEQAAAELLLGGLPCAVTPQGEGGGAWGGKPVRPLWAPPYAPWVEGGGPRATGSGGAAAGPPAPAPAPTATIQQLDELLATRDAERHAPPDGSSGEAPA